MHKSPVYSENYKIRGRFTRNARAAWSSIIAASNGGEKQKILLPSYIGFTEREGSGVFDPVQSNGCDYIFYKLDENLCPDLVDLEGKIAQGIDICLIVHYFGFCRVDLNSIKNLCKKNDVLMVEDCAHAFYLSDEACEIGSTGDYSFYSIHKHLPTDTGGLLRVNNINAQVPEIDKLDLANIDVVERFALANFEEIANSRRENFSSFYSKLKNESGLKILYELSDSDIPQSFPLLIKAGLREKLYFHLMRREMPTTALYYRLIDQIDKSEFSTSYDVSHSILNLPVHQDITRADIDAMCAEICRFLSP